jgi:hypothetical protein
MIYDMICLNFLLQKLLFIWYLFSIFRLVIKKRAKQASDIQAKKRAAFLEKRKLQLQKLRNEKN